MMNKYRAIYFYGNDRDDWADSTIEAATIEEAKQKARESVLKGYTFWKVKPIES